MIVVVLMMTFLDQEVVLDKWVVGEEPKNMEIISREVQAIYLELSVDLIITCLVMISFRGDLVILEVVI